MSNVLIFSEEYTKVTKGMCVVWTNHACETSKDRRVQVLLNAEHWAFEETRDLFGENAQVTVHRLPLLLPSSVLKRIFEACDPVWVLRASRFMFGQLLDLLFSPLIVFYLFARLRRARLSAVFSHNGGWPAGRLCRWIIVAAMLAGVPKRILIIHSHPAHPVRLLQLPFRLMQARLMDRCATSIVTVSDSVKAALESGVFRSPVLRIHNGLKLTRSVRGTGRYVRPLEWTPSGVTVGFVGAIYPYKGLHVLLDAFRLVEVPCELALLGPADRRYLRFLQLQAEVCANKVSFLGFHEDVEAFMQRIDVLVVPSIALESFSMVILEAMKHRKPVICSSFGGMKEVVEDGVTGLVVPAGDKAALADAMKTVLADRNMRVAMGEAGYHRLKKLFTAERMAAQYEQLLS